MEVRQLASVPWKQEQRVLVEQIVSLCSFEGHSFELTWLTREEADYTTFTHPINRTYFLECYIQLVAPKGKCRDTGEPWAWRSRKWRISKNMTESEIVRTCWLCAEVAMKHEHMESFLYNGARIFDPHVGVVALQRASLPANRDDREKNPMEESIVQNGEIA